MASFRSMRCASRNLTNLALRINSNSLATRLFSSKNIYLKKFKNRRNPKISDFDVEEVLMRGKASLGSVVLSGGGTAQADVTTSAKTNNTNNSWKHSEERLGYLKTSEKRVAVVAVLTMLFGYVGIKWMVSGHPSKKEEAQESELTTEPNVQPAS